MSFTDYPNGVTSFGIPMSGTPFVLGSAGVGTVYYVDATNGSDGNDGKSPENAFKLISVAYAAAASGDTIALSTNSSHSLTAGVAHTKSRINWIGLDFQGRLVQQGAKVQLATAATTAYVIKNTGTRNSFNNIKFIMGATAATGLHVIEEGGEGTLYRNCSFTFGVADNLDLTTAFEVLNGGDSCTWIDCQFGVDTLLTSAARSVMKIDQVTASQEFKSNRFRGCNFLVSSSDADVKFISMAAAGDILFSNLFEDCTFTASIDSAGGAAITSAVTTANGTVKGTLYFRNPVCFGVTDFGTNGTNNDGLQVYGPSFTTGTDLVGIAPVAT